MKYPLLLLLLLPTILSAQVITSVEPVISWDYMEQVRKLRGSIDPIDSISNSHNTNLKLKGQFYPNFAIRRIKVLNGNIQLLPQYTRYITLSGTYNGSITVKIPNRQAELQSAYAQGRAVNGTPVWKGPETGELFSYGPALSTLEYDGSTYPYDQQGKLVPLGTGNGKLASAYDNRILRTAVAHSHQFRLQGGLFRYGKQSWNFSLRAGQTNENTVIQENKSKSNTFASEVGATIKWLTIKGSYLYNHNELSNGNRDGFLNRAYQHALLTPASFSNSQGITIGEAQRSYSDKTNNPLFLLRDNNNSYRWTEHVPALTLELKTNNLNATLTQSLLHTQENNIESYKPGTVEWLNGMYTDRSKRDFNYLLQSQAIYDIAYPNSSYHSQAGAYYTYGNADSRIQYQSDASLYKYQRSSHDLFLTFNNSYRKGPVRVQINAGNKMYLSNTASQKDLFLPAVDVSLLRNNVIDNLDISVSASYQEIKSELPIDKSLAYINLLQYSTQQASSYRPVTEVSGYKNLLPISHREWDGRFSMTYWNRVTLRGDMYIRNRRNDVFPIYENGTLRLKNMADLQHKGIELSLELRERYYNRAVGVTGTVSLFSYRNTVTRVNEGDNYTPLAGFSNVHKTLVEGQQLGVIVGNAYLRDASGKMIIGNDGFPVVDPQPKVIANPTPDFIMKFSNTLRWNMLSLQTNLEWKKGGEAWNGTQAVLDYYGRSAVTGTQRNINNYIFPGIKQDGHVNDIPVSFYDASQPVENNRWTRYGLTGVAEAYVQKTDYLRINQISLAYRFDLNKKKQRLSLSTYVTNILLWSPYEGADPAQQLYDQPNAAGLDFFNLPALKTYGFNVSYQF